MNNTISYDRVKDDISKYLKEYKGVDLIDATKKQLYIAISHVVNKYLIEKYGVNPSSVVTSAGQIVLTFPAQASAVNVKVVIKK